LISSFERPFAWADTAAPLRRECPENPVVGMPARSKYSWTLVMKYCFEKGSPRKRANAGELGEAGHCEMSLRTALTGHNGDNDGARYMSTFVATAVLEDGRATVRPEAVNLRCCLVR